MSESGESMICMGCAAGDEVATVTSGARAKVDDIVGAANGFLIMLDDEHGISKITQVFERGEQAAVVTGMKSDGRFVKHVEHAAEFGSDLGGQPNALAFAAGDGCRGTARAKDSRARHRREIAGAR